MNICKKSTLIRLLLSSYMAIMFIATIDIWKSIISSKIGKLYVALKDAMQTPIYNWCTFVFIVLLFIVLTFKVFKKQSFSIYLYPILSASCFICFTQISNSPDTIIPGLSYTTLVGVIILVLLAFVFISDITPVAKQSENSEDYHNGFIIDTKREDLTNIGWADYMSTLLTKINSTDIFTEAFTVGISGRWGAGKTTFLQELENQLRANNYIIVKFNPWNSHSSQQVITSFFSVLTSALNVKKDNIGEALTEYGNLLADLDVHPLISKLLQRKEKDVDALKRHLQEQMANCGSKISILIDDIDRLDQNEVYETLRLIRETANFPNIVYFVAYDSRHVINMLAEKGISNGNEYIRKIFQVEISLPGYESYILPILLYKDIKKHIINKDDLHMVRLVTASTTKNGEYLLAHYLKNFRDVKRFVNSFVISYSHITTKLDKNEYCVRDLMWLELLHYSDLETYEKIYESPLTFLTSNSTEKGPVYSLRNEYSHGGAYIVGKKKDKADSDSPIAKYIKHEFPYMISEDTATLLSMLFNLSIYDDASIRYTENYNRYFAYRLPQNNIGTKEFRNALLSSTTSDELESVIEEWLTSFASKRQSLLRQMQLFDTLEQNILVCKNYLSIIVYLIRTAKPATIDTFCQICLDKKKYPKTLADELSNWLYKTLAETMPTLQFPWTWVYICKKLYPVLTLRFDEEGNEVEDLEPETLLTDTQLQMLSSANFTHYMDCVNHPPITDITKKQSNLNSFIKESIVPTTYILECDKTITENLIFDDLIKYYSVNKSDQFNEFIRPLTPDELSSYYQEDIDSIKNKICKIFNSYKGFKQFVKACFIETDDIQKYYKSIGIEDA